VPRRGRDHNNPWRPPSDRYRQLYFAATADKAGTLDFLPNICRAKYKSDDKIRKALVDIGVTSYEIDHEDVTVIAIKVLEKFAKSQGIH
jgi:hypothetical protein